MQIISRMMVITAVSNVADCCVYYLNGSSGILQIVLVFLSGSWLFLGNVLIGYTWAQFIMTHMNIRFTDTRKKIYKAVGMCCLHFFIFWTLVFVCDVPEKSWYAQAVSDTGISCCGCDAGVMTALKNEMNFEEEKHSNDKPYQLSVSMGYAVANLSIETIDDFMNCIDKQMYQDKLEYYKNHEHRKS